MASSPPSDLTRAGIYKNGTNIAVGSYVKATIGSYASQVSDIVYLNGTTDYLELFTIVTSTGTCNINSSDYNTYLSAVLVSGGSASGDSVWTEDGDTAVYDDGWCGYSRRW